jgi:hypothetical protein
MWTSAGLPGAAKLSTKPVPKTSKNNVADLELIALVEGCLQVHSAHVGLPRQVATSAECNRNTSTILCEDITGSTQDTIMSADRHGQKLVLAVV